MEQDIISYKTMFEKNNYMLAIMSENVEDQIFSLNSRLEELDLQGKIGKSTPGTRGKSRLRDQMLTVKSRKNTRKSAFFVKHVNNLKSIFF